MGRGPRSREKPLICWACGWKGHGLLDEDFACPTCRSTTEVEVFSRRRDIWRRLWDAEHLPEDAPGREELIESIEGELENFIASQEGEYDSDVAIDLGWQQRAYNQGRRDEERKNRQAVSLEALASRFEFGAPGERGAMIVERGPGPRSSAPWFIQRTNLAPVWWTREGIWTLNAASASARWTREEALAEATRLFAGRKPSSPPAAPEPPGRDDEPPPMAA